VKADQLPKFVSWLFSSCRPKSQYSLENSDFDFGNVLEYVDLEVERGMESVEGRF
jgi:hypothetical protein